MSEAGTYDFELSKGTTFRRVFSYKDSAGAAINLTGYTADFKARPSPDYGSDTLSKTGLSIDALNGTVTLYLTPSDTATIGDSSLLYSIVLKQGSDIYPFLIGTITITENVLV